MFSSATTVLYFPQCTSPSCISWIIWMTSGSNNLNNASFLVESSFCSHFFSGKIQIFVSDIFLFNTAQLFYFNLSCEYCWTFLIGNLRHYLCVSWHGLVFNLKLFTVDCFFVCTFRNFKIYFLNKYVSWTRPEFCIFRVCLDLTTFKIRICVTFSAFFFVIHGVSGGASVPRFIENFFFDWIVLWFRGAYSLDGFTFMYVWFIWRWY